jgi:hypothetical protein
MTLNVKDESCNMTVVINPINLKNVILALYRREANLNVDLFNYLAFLKPYDGNV